MASANRVSGAPPTLAPAVAPGGVSVFRGYRLVAAASVWLAGLALRAVAPLDALPSGAWVLVAAGCGALWLAVGLIRPPAGASGRGAALMAALVLGGCLALGGARAAAVDVTHAPGYIGHLADGSLVRVQGTVAAEPDVRGGFRLLNVDVTAVSRDGGHTWTPAVGRILASVLGPDDWFAPTYGDTVQISGTLAPSGGTAAPGEAARLLRARATVRARGGVPWLAALFDLRLRLAQAIQRTLPEPEAALLIGILLGMKTPVLRSRLALFTATGTIHLVVPAGLKVSLLAELAHRAARPLGRWPRTVAALLAVATYAALGGGGPAAVRAAIMGALLALAPALGRRYDIFTALALVAIILTALDPLALYDAGFQLTMLATLGLPLLVPPIQRRLAALALRWRVPAAEAVSELLAVTVAAQIAVAPVLALTFHQVSLIAPLANVLTVPLLGPVLVLGGMLALLGALPGAVAAASALALGWLLWPLLWFIDVVIAGCASLPGAAFAVGATPLALAWAYYGALALATWGAPQWVQRRLRRLRLPALSGVRAGTQHPPSPAERAQHARGMRGLIVALLVVALLCACGATVPALAQGTSARLDFLDVGPGGSAVLLRLPSGVTLLIDGGPDGPALEHALAARLPFWQRRLDLALLTDPRPGAARGLEDVAAHLAIGQGADMGMEHPSAEYLAWLDALSRAGDQHTIVRQGTNIWLDAQTTLRVLGPPRSLYPPGADVTTTSNDLIVRLDAPGLRALLLGSADEYALDALAGANEPLAADVVQVAVPRGAPLTLDGALGAVLAQAHPHLLVVTEAPVAPRPQPAGVAPADDGSVADALGGALIYRTSGSGTITLSGDAAGWRLGG